MQEAEKTRLDAQEKDKDRVVSAVEKQRDREAKERAAAQKSQRQVRVERGDDGSLTGYVEE